MKHTLFIILLLITHQNFASENGSSISAHAIGITNHPLFLHEQAEMAAKNAQHADDSSDDEIDVDDVFSILEADYSISKKSLYTIITSTKISNMHVLMNNRQFLTFIAEMQLGNGNTLLHEAGQCGDIKAIDCLLQMYKAQQNFTENEAELPPTADFVNCRNADMHTAFSLAVAQHQFDAANRLLKQGAYANPYVPESISMNQNDAIVIRPLLLSLLTINNNREGLCYLLAINHEYNLLDKAAKTIRGINKDDKENATSLLKQGFNKINCQQAGEKTLTDYGIEPDSNRDFYVKSWDKQDLLLFIIAKRSEKNTLTPDAASLIIRRICASSEDYNHILHEWSRNGDVETMRAIIQDETRFTLKDCPQLLLSVLRRKRLDINAMATMLIEHGAPLNVTDDFGNSLLHWAVQLPHDAVPISRRLIRHKAPINRLNEDNVTPLDIARKQTAISHAQQPRALQHLLVHTGAKTGHALRLEGPREARILSLRE